MVMMRPAHDLSGHDFSHAEKYRKMVSALAAEVLFFVKQQKVKSQGANHGQKTKEIPQIPPSKKIPLNSTPRKVNPLPRFPQHSAPATSTKSRNQRSPRLLARRLRRNAPRTTRRKSPRLASHRLANARASTHSPMGHPRLQPRRKSRFPRFPTGLWGAPRSPPR